MSRVMLTGASGFIGRRVLTRLQAQATPCLAIGRTPGTDDSWHALDLFDHDAVTAFMATHRPTHLIHLAWNTEHGKFWHAEDNIAWLHATVHLLKAFSDHGGLRAVVAGTCAEYDWAHGHCVEELTPCRPRSLYGEAKHAAHRLARQLLAGTDTELVWARIFFPVGPGEPAGRFIPSVVDAMLTGQPVRCSHGRQYRDFMAADDVAHALCHLLDTSAQGAINVGSGEPIRLSHIVERLAALTGWTGEAHFGALPVPDDDPPLLVADTRRLQATGWHGGTPLDAVLEDIIAWRRQVLAATQRS